MSLIQCADCGNRISDVAPTCPSCGRPGPLVRPPLVGSVQTVELTGKKWKKLQLWGGVFLVLSPFVCVSGAAQQPPSGGGMAAGMGAFVLGFGLLIWGRIGAFWHHK